MTPIANTGTDIFPHIPGYTIFEQIYSGSRTEVYRAMQTSQQRPVVIKLLRRAYPSFSELVQFCNQYTIAKSLDISGIIKPHNLEPYQNGYALVMEDFGGVALQQFTQRKPLILEQFIRIAIQLADILHQLYQHGVIHKDIKPANILIHPETQQVKLIDFSIASLLPRETPEIQSPNVLEGTLAYISPEQTGRMNRGIDYRTDFYSLGVTFYELLTGELPFKSDDPMELVHCHIAKQPSPLGNQENMSPVLSDIVMKLMAKNAEDRYQSALGLKYDLEQCLTQLQETDQIKSFEIGQWDFCDRFVIPDKLYGRESEVKTLLEAFERVAKGNSELMLVAGFSGIGKTAVVNEVHKAIVRQRGYFIKGKFDQFQRNIPLSAFVQAFREFMGQLLCESDFQLTQWKTHILAALGKNAQVIIDVIPELQEIIGEQSPVPELSGHASQNRFNLLFQKFIEVFTTSEHPLVIFLDDLQWADSASLSLMQVLMNPNEIGYLLMIGAYRDHEVSPAHPLILTLEKIQKSQAIVNTIILSPLQYSSINQLIADTLNCSQNLASPLTELVMSKTKGNPFFTTQFLKALYEENLITFNWKESYWECDIVQVQQLSLTDNLVEFMAKQLQKLPSNTQEILKLAACIGNCFDLATLAIVSQKSERETANILWKALEEGLIIPQTQVYKFYLQQTPEEQATPIVSYKFLHDRVQQAAYSLIPDSQKQTTHYNIGQLLLQKFSSDTKIERIFELVNQLNYGTGFITQQTKRDELAQLNLIACHQARSATAYQAARVYAQTGLFLLGEKGWQRQYEMSLAFYNASAELAALCGDFEAMEHCVETVIYQAHSLLEQVHVYRIKIQSNIAQNKLTEAIKIALHFLEQLGVTFPEIPTENHIKQEITEIRQRIGEREIEDLIHLPMMTDGEKIAIVQISNSIIPAACITGSPLLPLVVSFSVKLSIQYGNIPASAFVYAWYSIITCNLLKDIQTGVKFGKLALQVVSKLEDQAVKPEVISAVGLFILHRNSHTRQTLPLLQNGYETALEVGNQDMAGYNAHNFCLNSFWCGQSLVTLEQEIHAYCNELVQLKQLTLANWCRTYWQSILNLLGATKHPSILSGEVLQEAEFLPHLIKAQDLFGLYFFYLYKLMLCFLFNQIESAQDYTVEARKYLKAATATVGEPTFYFYDSLTLLASLRLSDLESSEILEQVELNQIQLQHWADYAPMNYQHKVDLVEAEKCRVLGQNTEALELYDKAISEAKTNEYIQEEALGNELAAKFYLNWGKEKVASGYMQEAYYCYARWGAKAKTDDLEVRYPHLLHPILQPAKYTLNPFVTLATFTPKLLIHTTQSSSQSSTGCDINTALDFATIIKASQTISSTIQLNELLRELTQIILKNSGGDHCALILPNSQGIWEIVAIATAGVTELSSQPLEENMNVPVKLVQYVKNTQEVVTFDNLKTDLSVIDAYLQQKNPQSVLTLPILNQGNLTGILYLENQSTRGAFTRDRILILNFLCTQAAISLENASLYQQAQNYAQQLEESQLQLIQSEKMSALGNLVAGVAHEINNPIGFIDGNLHEAILSVQDITKHLRCYQEKFPDPGDEVVENAKKLDIEYQLNDLPKILKSMQAGCDRIKEISTSLRVFSRADKDYKVPCNIHEGINSTLLILKHRLKANNQRPAIEVIKNYGEIPEIDCFPGQLNQVFMNILANGIDALDESCQGVDLETIRANPKQIWINTALSSDQQSVVIRISDNGTGMSEETKGKIFDHLFTTKAIGKGTGIGLAIARSIVVEKHHGTLTVNSKLKAGTEFIITLPLKPEITG